jgi:hypothetical protein
VSRTTGHRNLLAKAVVISLLLVPFCMASGWNHEETHSDARDFVPGGMLRVRLSVGDVRITHGDSNQIHLRYTVKSHRERNVKNAACRL